MKQGIEAICGLRYKLRMMGIPITGPAYVYGDNLSVIHNVQRPESVLKKKSNSICYHFVRESAAMNECIFGHINTNDIVADIATKIIPRGIKRNRLVDTILYDIHDDYN